MKKIKEILDRYVFEMWLGILIYGILCQVGAVFVSNMISYISCLWVGILVAMAATYHMWWSIDHALSLDEKNAAKQMTTHYIIRYLALTVTLGIMGILFGNYVLVTFMGIMAIKVGAYLHPLTKKVCNLIYGEEILPPIIENLYEEEITADKQ